MAGRGLRSILQPVLFMGIASLLHGILFLIPAGAPARRDSGTSRGIRVKTYVEEQAPSGRAPAATPASPRAQTATAGSDPAAGRDARRSAAEAGGAQAGSSGGPGAGGGGATTPSEFGQYIEHLRSGDVQGWARQSARASRQGWKGSGARSGGWGTGTGNGPGSGTGPGRGAAGGYLDPRVRMVVIRYPFGESGSPDIGKGTNIEKSFPPVPYPDLKVKKSKFTSGWWNVYIELWTTKDGRIDRYHVLRPETNGPQERVFVDQVKREMERWAFGPGPSEIHVDVRFYVE